MTKIEQAELNELGLTPEELEERRREVEAKLHAEPTRRRVRSDAGVRKGPKLVKQAPAQAGPLSDAQAAQLKALAEDMVETAKELAGAQRRNLQAAVAYAAFVDALTVKS